MRQSAKDAILEALDGIRTELVQIHEDTAEIRKEIVEMRLLDRNRSVDVAKRLRKVEDEGARHERNITDLQRRVATGR